MDWIEVTARTVDDAKELALDRLGVVEDELEFEVVDEPRKGLFGIGRSDARIRARVKPISREKPSDRKRRGAAPERATTRSGQGGGGGRSGGGQRWRSRQAARGAAATGDEHGAGAGDARPREPQAARRRRPPDPGTDAGGAVVEAGRR